MMQLLVEKEPQDDYYTVRATFGEEYTYHADIIPDKAVSTAVDDALKSLKMREIEYHREGRE